MQVGAFWSGVDGPSSDAFRETGPLLLAEKRTALGRAATGESVLQEAIESGDLNDKRNGPGCCFNNAVDLRAAAPTADGLFAVSRPSEIPQPVAADVVVNENEGAISITAAKQKNDPAEVGQSAYLVSIPA